MEKEKIDLRSYSGLASLLITAVGAFILVLRLFDRPNISAMVLYNAGVDIMGLFSCTVLYFGCMGEDRSGLNSSARSFIALIFMIAVSFFNNLISWYAAGNPERVISYLIFNTLTKVYDFLLVYFFHRYVHVMLEFKGKLAERLDKLTKILLIPATLLMVFNMFYPICFVIDEACAFHKLPLYWLVDLYMIFVAPGTAYLLLKSNATRKQKRVAMSFITIPIFHYAITGGAHGYSTQYGSALLALIMIYCVLFTERSKALASTQTELDMANGIQRAMLPNTFPPYPDRKEFDICAIMDPAKEVGGDFYDFYLIDDDHLCLTMADVSGKGVPAALFMMIAKTILQSCAMLGLSPAKILAKANEALCNKDTASMFVTVWIGILEISTGKLTAANAGHEYPFIKQNGQFALYKDKHGFVIGGMEGSRYSEYTLQLEPGDMVFVYTDGITDANGPSGELFGMERLTKVMEEEKNENCEEVIGDVAEAITRFVKSSDQFDDVTMLCMCYKGNGNA